MICLLLPLVLDLRGSSPPAASAFVPSSSSSSSSSSSMLYSSSSSPRDLVREGMRSFRMGDVSSSLSFFDAAEEGAASSSSSSSSSSSPSSSSSSSGSGGGSSSLAPYLWQRGISYYYLDRFADGHAQFRRDVEVNPNDVEEIVWDVACLARMVTPATATAAAAGGGGGGGGKYPPDGMMALPRGKKDPRKIMSTVYSLFRGDGATEWDLRKAGHEGGNASDEFYSLFYLGL